jgi:hypothetical protein
VILLALDPGRVGADVRGVAMEAAVMKVKALSVQEPWASRIAYGRKTVETRTWRTGHRGALLICASATPKSSVSGKAVALATLADCRLMTPDDEDAAQCNWYEDIYAWVLTDVTAVQPFLVKGRQGLYDVEIPFDVYVQYQEAREAKAPLGLIAMVAGINPPEFIR